MYNSPSLRGAYVQSVDFSTMLYGLAALPEYLGTGFFEKYNDFNFDPNTSSSAIEKEQKTMDIYPNPFSKKTTIAFTLESKAEVKIDIYSEKGDLIRQLINQPMAAGRHSISWDATDDKNKGIVQGTYFCLLTMNNRPIQTSQLIVVK
jgi:hypothetical protein